MYAWRSGPTQEEAYSVDTGSHYDLLATVSRIMPPKGTHIRPRQLLQRSLTDRFRPLCACRGLCMHINVHPGSACIHCAAALGPAREPGEILGQLPKPFLWTSCVSSQTADPNAGESTVQPGRVHPSLQLAGRGPGAAS